ncbi:hypothetical protein LCGC14_1946060 [marine sediment metagenome]|uniref:Uncharacterized protein n=1 Tax=marine sediment metagenome TaxID=412755 RepID=A0A0F9FJ73_9ZZZZ
MSLREQIKDILLAHMTKIRKRKNVYQIEA